MTKSSKGKYSGFKCQLDDNVSYFAEEDSEENDEPFFNLNVKDKLNQSMDKGQENEQDKVALFLMPDVIEHSVYIA